MSIKVSKIQALSQHCNGLTYNSGIFKEFLNIFPPRTNMSLTTLTWYGLFLAKIHYASIFDPKLLIILCPIIRHGRRGGLKI